MAAGTVGGAPLDVAKAMGANEVCPMKCCKKMSKEKQTPKRKNFCRLTSCEESVPSVPSTSSVVQITADFSETEVDYFYGVVDATRPKEVLKPPLEHSILAQGTPFFLRHKSLLL